MWTSLVDASTANAATAVSASATDAASIELRESRLSHRLRCVVCQNQTIAESNAPLAADMRQVIREQLRAGRGDDEIVAFFEQRYGAFVRYTPPWRPSTWLLWTGPFLLLAVGLGTLAFTLRRRSRQVAPPLDETDLARLRTFADAASTSTSTSKATATATATAIAPAVSTSSPTATAEVRQGVSR